MKFFLPVAALVAVASAATPDLSTLPLCSLACFAQASGAANCGVNDVVCQCTTGKATITNIATPCVVKSCSANDQLLTAAAVIKLCDAATGTSSTTTTSNSTSNVTTTSRPSQSVMSGTATKETAAFAAGVGLIFALFL